MDDAVTPESLTICQPTLALWADGMVAVRRRLIVEKVRDVVGLYVAPPSHAVVLCVDEKSQIQARGRQSHFNGYIAAVQKSK